MTIDRVFVARTRRDRTAPALSNARDSQRDLLCTAHRLPVARDATRLTALEAAYHYFWHWRQRGWWEQLNTTLREQVRVALGRKAQPSAGIIDSQSVKTTGVGGARGYDGGKKINGRKRHLLVDTQARCSK